MGASLSVLQRDGANKKNTLGERERKKMIPLFPEMFWVRNSRTKPQKGQRGLALNTPDVHLGCQYPVACHSLWSAIDRVQISISTSINLIVLTNNIMERRKYKIIEGKGTYLVLSRQVIHLQLCTYIWPRCGTGTDLGTRDTTVDNTQSLTSWRGHFNEE